VSAVPAILHRQPARDPGEVTHAPHPSVPPFQHYKGGIAAMHALGRDENADVANYIGYANRKLGNYDQSKEWYDKALAADPDHVRTWSYYGMWHMEQGNRLKAEDFLSKVRAICGTTTCEEYKELKAVIDGKASY
jgi:tetratricopeptide (TPR) repeat protein